MISSISNENLRNSSACATFLMTDPKQMALEQCISKIKQVIQLAKWELPSENSKKITCPITSFSPKDPVVTNCGHIFERSAFEIWQETKNSCPKCNAQISTLSPIHELRNLLNEWQQEDPIPTCSNFKGENQKLADRYLSVAKSCIADKDYEEALEAYIGALKYTNSSIDYASIPGLYDQLEMPEKATLSRLYLSLYQLQEKKFEETIHTLKQCESGILNVSSLIVGLTLQFSASSEEISKAMILASNQKSPEDRIFIYKQIITYDPTQLDAYIQLISLTKDTKEKRKFLLEAADLAHSVQNFDLEMDLRKKEESLVISQEGWANLQNVKLPPYPQALTDFLAQDCTIWPRKKRWETHIVVPLFPQIEIDGSIVPATLNYLGQLDKKSGGPGYSWLWGLIPDNIPAEEEFHYAVMTKDVIPGTRNRSYNDQIALLPTGYEVPGVFDAARAILWENRRSGIRYFNDDNSQCTYTRCREIVKEHHLVVGSFAPSGLQVCYFYVDNMNVGVAGWRKF